MLVLIELVFTKIKLCVCTNAAIHILSNGQLTYSGAKRVAANKAKAKAKGKNTPKPVQEEAENDEEEEEEDIDGEDNDEALEGDWIGDWSEWYDSDAEWTEDRTF